MGETSAPSDKLGESPAVELTGKIMIVAVIFLFFVVVLAFFFHLYSRAFWWRVGDSTAPHSRSRRPRRRHFAFASGDDGGLRSGLDPSVLRSLPVLVFQSQEFKEGLECAVCLSEVVEGEKARLLPKCNHGFHVDCIDMWFQSHSTCPLCRNPVHSEPESESSPTFPTNVLVWGDHTQITSSLDEGAASPHSHPPSSSSSSSASCSDRRQGVLVIDIPTEIPSSSSSPSDQLKSPMTGRLRSFKRLLSRADTRLNPWSPTSTSVDVEQAATGAVHT